MSFNLWHIAVLLILIALTLPALIHVWLPSNLPDIGKLAWTLIIVLLPGLGPLLWYCWRLSMKIMQRSREEELTRPRRPATDLGAKYERSRRERLGGQRAACRPNGWH